MRTVISTETVCSSDQIFGEILFGDALLALQETRVVSRPLSPTRRAQHGVCIYSVLFMRSIPNARLRGNRLTRVETFYLSLYYCEQRFYCHIGLPVQRSRSKTTLRAFKCSDSERKSRKILERRVCFFRYHAV